MWAAATSRAVGRIASFKGMTGTAATAAMAQALMEASLPIAQADSAFFQTVTLQNLNNRQASTINKANVLAKMDLSNLDSRMAAAVQNSKNFLEMDLANLNNRQQSEILNTQARVQSILEDAKAINTQRLFTATSQNEMDKFYDEMNSNISQFNASQKNSMSQFNADQKNTQSRFNTTEKNNTLKFNAEQINSQNRFNASERNDMYMANMSEKNAQERFNADLENNRQQFYSNMQYNIDTSNAKWRQTVTLTESAQQFEAAAADVKNMTGIGVEQLNQIWDRSDALLDYLWKSTENDLERSNKLALSKMSTDSQDKAGLGSVFGSLLGNIVGKADSLGDIFSWFSF